MIDTTAALHLLLEGKTLRSSDDMLYRVHNGKLAISCNEGLDWYTDSDLNKIEEVLEEFPLTFAQALRAMLGSRVVMPEAPIAEIRLQYRFNCVRSCFEYQTRSDGDWKATHIGESEQKSKWKVIE
ncbi:MAG: hypothetical protein J6K69_07205 [Candidatus Methanomethylophilaceae archaeon]|nr:hypothetical protein [Candidatus Methanomethylophilaceae archaeon]